VIIFDVFELLQHKTQSCLDHHDSVASWKNLRDAAIYTMLVKKYISMYAWVWRRNATQSFLPPKYILQASTPTLSMVHENVKRPLLTV
jgi:hypothetical protein